MNQKKFIEKYISTTTQPLDEYHKELLLSALLDDRTPHTLKSNIVIFLRKHRHQISPDELAGTLNINPSTAEELLNNGITEAFFPAVNPDNENKQELIKLFVIELKNSTFSFKKGIENELKVAEKLTGKHFFVGFSQDFSGKSFLLALVSALICKKSEKLKNYAFTGDLDFEGKVLEVDFLEEKKGASSQKKLIHSKIIKNIKELDTFLNSGVISIPFSIALKQSKKDTTPEQAALSNLYKIEQNTDFKLAKRLYNLKDDDFIFYTNYSFLPKNSWENLLKSAYNKIMSLKSKIKDKTCITHFCFLAPATFCFGFGAMVGCKEPFVAYHYTSSGYKTVFDYSKKSTRFLKSFTNTFNRMECKVEKENNNSKIIAFSIYAASHNPAGDIARFLAENFNDYSIATCKAKDRGNLKSDDWTVYVNEIYSFYNKLKEMKVNKKLMFFSCPVPLAFGLGVAVETFDNIEVFNFDPESASYFKVFNLASLRV